MAKGNIETTGQEESTLLWSRHWNQDPIRSRFEVGQSQVMYKCSIARVKEFGQDKEHNDDVVGIDDRHNKMDCKNLDDRDGKWIVASR